MDRFSFLITQINEQSGLIAGTLSKVSALEDGAMISTCRFYEEMDGRINSENLNHLMVLGCPYLTGDDLQNRLKQQVLAIWRYLTLFNFTGAEGINFYPISVD